MKYSFIEKPEKKRRNKTIKIIKIAVDKLEGIIKKMMKKEGNKIYLNTDVKDVIVFLYKKRLRERNRIKLYFANSDGWKEKKPTLIQRLAFAPGYKEGNINKYNNNMPETNNKITDKLVKYL